MYDAVRFPLGLILVLVLEAFGPAAVECHAQGAPRVAVTPSIGHAGNVAALAFTPNGHQLATAGHDASIKVWDMRRGKLLRTLLGHIHSVSAVAYAPDGRHLISGSLDNTIKLWDAVSGQLLTSVPAHSAAVTSLTYSRDGKFILSTGQDRLIKLWESATLEFVRAFSGHTAEVSEAYLSSDGKVIVSAGFDGTVRIWDSATGRVLHVLQRHTDRIMTVALSPDGQHIASGSKDSTVKVWRLETGQLEYTIQGKETPSVLDEITSIRYSPDGKYILAATYDNAAHLWNAGSGELVMSVDNNQFMRNYLVFFLTQRPIVAFTPGEDAFVKWGTNGFTKRPLAELLSKGQPGIFASFPLHTTHSWLTRFLLAPDGNEMVPKKGHLAFIDTATGRVVRTLEEDSSGGRLAWSPNGRMLAQLSSENDLVLTDPTQGTTIHVLKGHTKSVRVAAFSPDSALLASGDWGEASNDIIVWETTTGRRRLQLEGVHASVTALAFSPDGRMLLSGGWDNQVKLWHASSGKLLHRLEVRPGWVNDDTDQLGWVDAAIFLDGGRSIVAASRDGRIRIWDTTTGKLVVTLDGHGGGTHALATSPRGDILASGGNDNLVKLWDYRRGTVVRKFAGHLNSIWQIAFSPTGDKIYSSGNDALRIWKTVDERPLAAMFSVGNRGFLTITQSGFFRGAQEGIEELNIVDGYELFNVEQVHQSLFNPDLVREALAGDVNGEVVEAAKVINLETVVGSGPAPDVTFARHSAESTGDIVELTARITDRGKGVGRVEWRINGVTAAVVSKPHGAGPDYTLVQQLALDPDKNAIEVVAYNASNLLASVPARTTISYTGPADRAKPRLHVLAIGINDYTDPGVSGYPGFAKLKLAVKDAETLGAELKRAGGDLYAGVPNVLVLRDGEATRDNIAAAIDRLAHDIHPRDTFILFASGHGVSRDGHFFLIPHDYKGGTHRRMLQRNAVSQGMLQDWLANRIKAKKALILLDTCESGALVAGHLRSRVDEAGIGRLHEATGRPILTAAAAGQLAREGKIRDGGEDARHGIFTWALLDALKKGDTNNDGKIMLSELVAHVQFVVPNITAEKLTVGDAGDQGTGTQASAAVSEFRGAGTDFATPSNAGPQSARFGSRGEDFAIARVLQ